MARKKAKAGTTRSFNLHMRLLEKEAKAFKLAAAQLGMNTSQWMRFVCRRECGLNPKDEE